MTKELILVNRARWILFEVRCAAKDLARKGYAGAFGDPLPDLLSSRCVAWIERNPRRFREMIRRYSQEV